MHAPMLLCLSLAGASGYVLQAGRVAHASPRAFGQRMALFDPRPLEINDEWEGLVSKITDFGCFVRLGHEQHQGLIHISTLSDERLDRGEVSGFIEREVGPVGSKVRVQVLGVDYKGRRRVSLKLIDVVSKQRMEQVVFAPGPRRMASGLAEAEGEDGGTEGEWEAGGDAPAGDDDMRGSATIAMGVAKMREFGILDEAKAEVALRECDGDVFAAVMKLSQNLEEEPFGKEDDEEG